MVLSFGKKIPTLVELCIQTAIDNIRYIGDVGETDTHLLKEILPHCTSPDQLMHIENCSEGRDLSPVTDSLWKRFYERNFGEENYNLVVQRMKKNQIVVKWRLLYEAKLKERDEVQKKSVERLTTLFKEQGAKKQSRQIKLCSKVPPSSKKRNLFGGCGSDNALSSVKGNLMKKAKIEYLNSHEARIHQAMRKNDSKRVAFSTPSVSRSVKPNNFLGKSSASCSKPPSVSPSMKPSGFLRKNSASCSKPSSVSQSMSGFLGKSSASCSKLNKPLSRPKQPGS